MIHYIGEHSTIAFLGKLFTNLALAGALFSMLLYLFSARKDSRKILLFGRAFYLLHFLSIVVVSVLVYRMIFGHYFEFAYIYKHSSSDLPTNYLVSAFWAGQEGSFLLWVFFQSILGLIMLRTAKHWEGWIMAIIAFFQLLLTTMIWGIRPFGAIIGQSPFTLLREETANLGLDFFKNPNYVSMISDGQGINPLLENYWMVIHPPILFIGYAAAIIPFAYAITALIKRNYVEWLKPAFPWIGFAGLSLGVGILLGGAWAYESLTFGGFWAWDPVENASLVPWLLLLGAMHTMILNRKRKHSYGMSFILIIASFVMVLYASYLTRSGVLGETSAHAFGNNGLSAQMVVMLLATILISLFLYFINFKRFPKNEQDSFLSREFWMYLGTIILIISAFQISLTTSLPVINKVFGSDIAPPLDRIGFFNQWQIPFGLFIMATLAVSMILKYGKNSFKNFTKAVVWPLFVGVIFFVLQIALFKISSVQLLLFLFFTSLVVVSSAFYLVKNRFNLLSISSSIAHFGIALFLTGVIVAFSQANTISKNTSQFDFGDQVSNNENQLLNKGEMTKMGDYQVVYNHKVKDGKHVYFYIDFYKANENGKIEKKFTVKPMVSASRMMGNVYDPDTRHEAQQDVYTYITFADLMSEFMGQTHEVVLEKDFKIKDTLMADDEIVIFDSLIIRAPIMSAASIENIKIDAQIKVIDKSKQITKYLVSYIVKEGSLEKTSITTQNEKLKISFSDLGKTPGSVKLKIERKKSDFIVVKSIVFPWILFVWLGAIITFIGLAISLFRNIKLSLKA